MLSYVGLLNDFYGNGNYAYHSLEGQYLRASPHNASIVLIFKTK
jgi:hypothetical protein